MQIKMTEKNSNLKNLAKDYLSGKYQATVMTFLFYVMLVLLFARFSNSLTEQFCITLMQLFSLSESSVFVLVFTYLIPFIVSVLENMIQIGICLYFLNIACHHNFNTFDLLYGYSHQFGKNFCLSAIITFFSFISMLPLDSYLNLRLSNSLDTDTCLMLAGLQIVLGLLYLFVYLSLSQIFFVTLDHPELSVKEILRQSMKLMSGQKLRLFLLDLSFLPLSLLILPTLGTSLFWIMPYLNMTHSLFFLDLMHADLPNRAMSETPNPYQN